MLIERHFSLYTHMYDSFHDEYESTMVFDIKEHNKKTRAEQTTLPNSLDVLDPPQLISFVFI